MWKEPQVGWGGDGAASNLPEGTFPEIKESVQRGQSVGTAHPEHVLVDSGLKDLNICRDFVGERESCL